MTPILAAALIAIVIVVVVYCIGIYCFGFQREFFLVPPVENIDDMTDDEIAIVSEQRVRELAPKPRRIRRIYTDDESLEAARASDKQRRAAR